ncbi:enoyl-CoA hydratase/isomerase family protein [Mycobacterium kansasii 824]|nr:enoyl-CoA hydratase/isomerase family protein [Mycobacterium kansasii 824]
MTETLVKETPRSGVVVIRLNRPERLNAINDAMLAEFTRTFASLAADASVKAVVLTGAGRGFCSGIDVRDFGPARRMPATRPSTECAFRRQWRPYRGPSATCRSRLSRPSTDPVSVRDWRCAWLRISGSVRRLRHSAMRQSFWGCRGPRWG